MFDSDDDVVEFIEAPDLLPSRAIRVRGHGRPICVETPIINPYIRGIGTGGCGCGRRVFSIEVSVV